MSRKKYFIGVDVGTQGTKSAIVSAEGETICEAFKPSSLIQSENGSIEQDPDELYLSVIEGIKDLISTSGIDAGQILAIGLDGQMAGVIGIDKEWNALINYDSWLDTRCEKYMPIIKKWGEEEYISITGCPVTYAHGPKVLWWKHEHPDTYERIDKFVVLTAYLAGRMAGLKSDQAYIDYTHIHFSGFADVEKQEWSNDLLDAFKVHKDKMPRIVKPWEIIGRVTKTASEQCGLKQGTPIVAGCGDTAAGILGAGIIKEGLILDIAGTASVLSCCVQKYRPDIKYRTLIFAHSVLPGLWTPLAYIGGGGQCISWFKKQLTGIKAMDYDVLNCEAKEIGVGSDGLYFVPHFAGRTCPNNPDLRGSWIGMDWRHTRAHMYRSIMESVAYEYKYYLDIIRESIDDVEFIKIIGVGGGTKSKLFNQIKADVLGVPYIPRNRADTATTSCSILAGYGIGYYNDIKDTIDSFTELGEKVEYSGANFKSYEKFANIYLLVLDHLSSLYKGLN